MSAVLFSRAWIVTIGLDLSSKNSTSQALKSQALGVSSKEARVYASFSIGAQPPSPLRVEFDIDKQLSNVANKASIKLTNLSSLSRLLYQQDNPDVIDSGYMIRLDAGYAGLSGYTPIVQTIYLGNVRTVTNERKGNSIVTTFECGEAEKQILLATFQKSYPAKTTYLRVLQDLVAAASIPVGTVIGIENFTFNQGFVVNGAVQDSLSKLLAKTNLEWSVQNGALNIKPITKYNNSEVVVLSNQTGPQPSTSNVTGAASGAITGLKGQGLSAPGLTGLIGVPSQNRGITQFESLLNPKVLPGGLVQIFSENIPGQYFQVRRAHFVGDSHGNKWSVAGEGTPVNQRQIFRQNQGQTLVAEDG